MYIFKLLCRRNESTGNAGVENEGGSKCRGGVENAGVELWERDCRGELRLSSMRPTS